MNLAKQNRLTGLQVVLLIKIVLTLGLWALPFLLPDLLLDYLTKHLLGISALQPKVYIHLLGATFLALVVGYISAFFRINNGKDVKHIIWAGVVSNGLASAILLLYGFAGAYQSWSTSGQMVMWGSAVATGLITLGLIATGGLKDTSSTHSINL